MTDKMIIYSPTAVKGLSIIDIQVLQLTPYITRAIHKLPTHFINYYIYNIGNNTNRKCN